MTKWYLCCGDTKYVIQFGLGDLVHVTMWKKGRLVGHGLRQIMNRSTDLQDYFIFHHEQFFLKEFRPCHK